jgi:hypothetical protein
MVFFSSVLTSFNFYDAKDCTRAGWRTTRGQGQGRVEDNKRARASLA